MKITRNNPFRRLLFVFLAVVSTPVFVWAQGKEEEKPAEQVAPPMIRKLVVNFMGLSNVNEEVARANMSLREGEPYEQMMVDRDIRSLYRTGLFEYVEVRLQPVDADAVDVVFDIRPKFRVASVIFDGNKKFRSRRLEREVTVFVNEVLNERKVNDNVLTLKEFYLKKGYSQVRVTYDIDRNPATGFGNVIFRIHEGEKYKIGKIFFSGNEMMKDRKLRRQMKTKRWGFLSVFSGSGKFDADKFEDDLETVRELYKKEGHLDIDIDPSRVQFSYPKKNRMNLDIQVDEGKLYHVGDISFDGNELYKEEILRLLLSARKGQVYKPEKLDEDLERIEDFYGNFGYMETRLRLKRVPNVSTGDIDLIFQIYESEKFQVESIDIEGNSKTKSTVVIRELALSPGSTFDSVRMESSRMRLENTRFFEDVNVAPQSTNIPGRKDLRITFSEGRTGNFSFGAGFSSLEKGMFFVELTQSNFDILNWRGAFQGDGQKFRVKAQLGSESSQILLSFEEPWLFEQRLALGFTLFNNETSYESQYYQGSLQKGLSVYLRKRLFELVEGWLTFNYLEQDYEGTEDAPEEQLLEASIGTTQSVNLLLLRDRRDRLINTFRGSRYELDLTSAGGVLGGDFDYYKIESRNAYYFPLTRWHTQTIEFLARAGVVKQTEDSAIVPYDQRFFLGGPNTLRGFEFRDITPKDQYTPGGIPSRIGGKTYGMVGAEYSIGFTEGFRGAIFYDGGFVNRDAGDFGLDREGEPFQFLTALDPWNGKETFGTGTRFKRSGWHDNYGVGIRISVMGTPLRLDYAIPLTTDDFNDEGSQFNFTFGGRF